MSIQTNIRRAPIAVENALIRAGRNAYHAFRALTERPQGAEYRAAYGAESFSRSDIADMRADPHWPVSKRPRPVG